MGLIVQKFGGTSVADDEKILAAARKAVRAQQQGNRVVVVVSAMGKNTDQLVALARKVCHDPPAREMDMLLSTGEQVSVALMAMAVHGLGARAVSLTGGQIGIRTDSTHTKARIRSISTRRITDLLDAGNIVIAAGFQGIDEDANITTLGRGGSDTTAVALAAVLDADACEIYTDVDGVYTTDPRILPEARQMERVSYDEMLELASLGAGVMHSRSIEFGKKFSVPIHVRSSFSDAPGTVIGPRPESPQRPVCGVAVTRDEARVTLEGVPDRPGMSLGIFNHLAAENIPIDMIVQNVGEEGRADVSFTVLKNDLPATLVATEAAAKQLGAQGISFDDQVAMVSAVGLGMARQSGVAHEMFRALADAGVNLQMITTSEIKISVLVARDQAIDALRAVHRRFTLDEPPPVEPADAPTAELSGRSVDAQEVVTRLQAMEELTIDEIALDRGHGRVTVRDVPDRPGVAAELFERVAAAGVLVDMIVQSTARGKVANLSFTVPRQALETSRQAAAEFLDQIGEGTVTTSPTAAKLSVAGIGMRSHTSVATRMFEALAGDRINVDMINTSEVQVSVVVDEKNASQGLAGLRLAFQDVLR